MSRTTLSSSNRNRWFGLLLLVAACSGLSGCTAFVSPINAVPANRLPDAFLASPRANDLPINLARLRQQAPEEYLLDSGDILGISIESILGKEGEPPPVSYPEPGSGLPPAIGYPIPVNEEGMISLPLIPPIPVKGLTLTQTRELIARAYMQDQEILKEDRIIVTLIRKRTIRVVVVRQDNSGSGVGGGGRGGGGVNQRSDESSSGFVLDLPAYENDVLRALAQTGGLPGLNAKNEIKIQRGNSVNFRERDQFIVDYYKQQAESTNLCSCPLPPPDDPSILKIPLRLPPGRIPEFKEEDIILNDGDIVYVETRDTEVFYAGGLLNGGEYPIPRDYDLDVLGALALTGGSIGAPRSGSRGGGSGGSLGGLVDGAPPQQLIVLRKTPCNGQIAVEIDLNKAVNDPSYRILVQPGDTLILRYRPVDEAINFGLGTFFTYGIRQLFRN